MTREHEEQLVVAVRCPTCGHLVEAELIGQTSHTSQVTMDQLQLHAMCDILAIYRELSRTAREIRSLIYIDNLRIWREP